MTFPGFKEALDHVRNLLETETRESAKKDADDAELIEAAPGAPDDPFSLRAVAVATEPGDADEHGKPKESNVTGKDRTRQTRHKNQANRTQPNQKEETLICLILLKGG